MLKAVLKCYKVVRSFIGGINLNNRTDRDNSIINKIVAAFVLVLLISTITGCGVSVVSLTEEENYEIARYMADKLLQYDKHYGSEELVYIDPTAPTEEPAATDIPVVTPGPTQTPVAGEVPLTDGQNPETTGIPSGTGSDINSGDNSDNTTLIDWSEFFTTDEWVITYSSYDTCQSYPKQSDVYLVKATKGKKLLVISFDVINKTDKSITIDLTEDGLNYKLHIGDDEYEPKITILDNGGLMYLNIKLKPFGQDKAVLIFEVPEGADLSNMSLDVSK